MTSGRDTIEPQLKKAGVTYQVNVYPGVNQAFHNDTGTRYSPDRSRKAWADTIDWFKKYLA